MWVSDLIYNLVHMEELKKLLRKTIVKSIMIFELLPHVLNGFDTGIASERMSLQKCLARQLGVFYSGAYT